MFKLIDRLPLKIKKYFLFGAFLVVLSALLNIFAPNILSQFTKLIFSGESDKRYAIELLNGRIKFAEASLSVVTRNLIIAAVVVTLLSMFFTFFSTLFIVIGSERTVRFLRNEMYDKLQKFSIKNISDFKIEAIITRVNNDVGVFWQFLVNGSSILVRGIVLVFGGAVLALLVNPVMSTAVFLIIPVIMLMILVVSKIVRPNIKKSQVQLEYITKQVNENVLGVRVIKTYNLENLRKATFQTNNEAWKMLQNKVHFAFSALHPVLFMFIQFLITGVYAFAARELWLTQGPGDTTLLANISIFTDYLFIISYGLMNIVQFLFSTFRAKVSASRIIEIYETSTEDLYISNGKSLGEKYDLEVKNLNFKYFENSPKYVLKDINFKLPENSMLGIIGPTGSGKSTLVNLIMNNFKYTEGNILVNGKEVNSINTAELHQKVGIVYQETLLYTGTIKSNLLWSKENASESELIKACENACALNYINSFDDKFEHPIVQAGKNLSGGQKQRLSVARTLLREPKILILDDSTSALDNITTKKLIENIKNNYNCSTIVVSQKIGAIKNADNILVMDDGAIIAQGKHEELIKICPIYRDIYLNQLEQ